MASVHLAATSKSIRKLTRGARPCARAISADDHVIMQDIMTRNDSTFDRAKAPTLESSGI